MALKASKKKPTEPECESTRKVPDNLGGGEVRLYNAHKHGLPDLAETPPEKLLAECAWFLVHFPSRRWVAVSSGRGEGLRLLKKLESGKDECGLLPPKPPPARARVCVGVTEPVTGEVDSGKREKPEEQAFTEVPEGADFDQAMQHVFPVKRLTENFERLLRAEEDVYDKEGNWSGTRPAFGVQFQALKALVEWHQGRPTEKPKKKDTRPVVTLEEMRRKMRLSPEYLAAMQEMCSDVAREVAQEQARKHAKA